MARLSSDQSNISNLEAGLKVLDKMNDTFLNTLLELSEKEKREEGRIPQSGRPSSVLFSRPPSSILVSRPPSAAIYGLPPSSMKRPKRPPSTSTLKPRYRREHHEKRPPSVSTIALPVTSYPLKKPNNIKCKVCTDGYRFPGNTPCFDHYCAECLEHHVLAFKRGTGCDCPLCKSGILLPSHRPKSAGGRLLNKSELNVCGNCQEARLAQYRCGSCEEFFCEKCNRDFLKRMRLDMFNVSHLGDLTGDNDAPLIMPPGIDDDSLDSISLPSLLPKGFGLRCPEHEEEELRFHCKDCDKSICRDCKILSHDGHETIGLEDVYEDRKHLLSQEIKISNANVRKLHAECAEINSKRLEIDDESRNAISHIENHANEAKRLIDELAKSYIKSIRVQNTQSREKLEECRDVVKDKVKMLQKMVEEGRDLLEAENGLDIIDKAPEVTKTLKDVDTSPTADKLWRKKFVFEPAGFKQHTARKMFGKLRTVMEGLMKEVPSVELQVESTFNSDQQYKSTTAIAPMSDGTVWVCNGYKNRIQKFTTEGEVLQTETLDFDVDDMTGAANGLLFITEINGKTIRKLNKLRLTIFARADLYLRGLSRSRGEEMVIACGNDVPVACLREAAITKLYAFNMKGQTIREFTLDIGMKGVSLFRVCHTINDEYVVSTGISALYFIVDENGNLKYRYKATSTADGVSCDAHGLIYLSACKDDTLYLLDCKGVPIPSTYAMHKPTAVAIDKNDVVWVGDWSKVHVLKYKL
ncbi:hypothetical protein ACF0H5_004623 [Mactra antiquata]